MRSVIADARDGRLDDVPMTAEFAKAAQNKTLRHGADLDRLNKDGKTAWELAQQNRGCRMLGYDAKLWNPDWKVKVTR